MALVRAIALAHRDRLAQLYEHMRDAGDFSPDAASAGRRALRNACLRYLTAADDEAAAGLADAHYRTADNMTDMIAGLAALTRMESPLARRRLHPFPRPLPGRSAGAGQVDEPAGRLAPARNRHRGARR